MSFKRTLYFMALVLSADIHAYSETSSVFGLPERFVRPAPWNRFSAEISEIKPYKQNLAEDDEKPSICLISEKLSDARVGLNEKITLHCEAYGTPAPTIVWKKDGKIVQGAYYLNNAESVSNHGQPIISLSLVVSELVIPCASEEDAGTYTCSAFNGYTYDEHSAEVTVVRSDSRKCKKVEVVAPRINMYTQVRIENKSNTVQLNCRGNGKATKIFWFDADHQPIENDKHFMLLPNGDLLIDNVQRKHQSYYYCGVATEYGSIQAETTTTLIVIDESLNDWDVMKKIL